MVADGAGAEVGRLAASFTAMLGALATSRRQQRQLVMDASHELRTPLMSLRTNVDVLRRRDDLPPGDRVDVLTDIDAELGELTELVSELVDLAADLRAEEAVVPVDLAELAEPVVERARRRTDRRIEVDVVRSAAIDGRPSRSPGPSAISSTTRPSSRAAGYPDPSGRRRR
ncbi:MAG: histidine kinase dimerization/phospho-acceptor domain-containing protein [Acidimicrobiales bacterium]